MVKDARCIAGTVPWLTRWKAAPHLRWQGSERFWPRGSKWKMWMRCCWRRWFLSMKSESLMKWINCVRMFCGEGFDVIFHHIARSSWLSRTSSIEFFQTLYLTLGLAYETTDRLVKRPRNCTRNRPFVDASGPSSDPPQTETMCFK